MYFFQQQHLNRLITAVEQGPQCMFQINWKYNIKCIFSAFLRASLSTCIK